jgi:hypothetical protein
MDLTDPTADQSPRCLLIYNDPRQPSTSGGAGWLLVTAVGTARPATVALAPHGADRFTGPRTAKVVAARVLAEYGHEVTGWHDRSTAPPVFRAVLLPGSGASLPQDPPAVDTSDTAEVDTSEVDADEVPAAPVMRVRRLPRLTQH